MADTELSIQIESQAERAIGDLDKVDGALERIEKSLEGLSNKLDHLSNLDKISSAVDRIADSISKIDVNKIKNLTNAVDNMSESVSKTEKQTAKSFNGITNNISEAEKAIEKSARKIASDFNFDKKGNGLEETKRALTDLYNALKSFNMTGNTDAFYAAHQNLEKVIQDYARIKVVLTETQQKALDTMNALNLSGNKIDLGSIVNEYTNDLKELTRLKNILGSAFKGDTAGGTPFDTWFDVSNFPEIRSEMEKLTNDGKNAFKVLADYIGKLKTISKEGYMSVEEFLNAVNSQFNAIQMANGKDITGDPFEKVKQAAYEYQNILQRIVVNENEVADALNQRFAPTVTDIQTKMGSFADYVERAFKMDLGQSGSIGDFFKMLPAEIQKSVTALAVFESKINELATTNQRIVDAPSYKILEEELGDAEQAVRSAEQALLPLKDDIESTALAVIPLAENFQDVEDEVNNATQAVKDLGDAVKDIEVSPDIIDNIKTVQDKIEDVEETPIDNKNSLEFIAGIIAIQHELEKVSNLMSHWGDVAKNAFLKALTPLKLFKHEFEEIKTFVERIGSGFAMIFKPITKLFSNLHKKAEESFAKMRKAWGRVLRTFTFMVIRKAITAVLMNIEEATKSLAKFSKEMNTKFNESMSYLTSDFRYIAASLVAAFSPILNAVMPILDKLVDAIVEVINKVNMFLTVLTGAKSFTIAKKKIVDYTDALKDANKAAKQLTMGIDELNILNDTKSSSALDAEDLFDWQEISADAIPQAIKDAAEKVKDIAQQLWNPIKEAWDNAGDYVKEGFKHMLDGIRDLLSDIGRDFLKVWQQPETVAMLEDILGIFGDIFHIIGNIADGLREAWNYNETGLHILENIRDLFAIIFNHIHNITSAMVDWSAQLDFKPILTAFEGFLHQFNYMIDQMGYVFEDVVLTVILPLLQKVLEDYAPRVIGVIGNISEGIGNIAKQIHKAWDELDFGDRVVAGIDGIVQAILPHIEAIGESFMAWADNLDFKPLMNAFTRLLNSLKPVADFVGGVFEDIVNHYILPMAKHITEKVIPMIMNAISHFADTVDWTKLRKNIDRVIEAFEHLQGAIGEGVADALDRIGQALANFVNSAEFEQFIKNITDLVNRISPELVSNVLTAIGLAIIKIGEALVKFVNSEAFQSFINALINFLTYTSADKLANILLGIAKAIMAFKFGAFVTKGFANFLSFIPLIAKIKEAKALKQIANSLGDVGKKASSVGEVLRGIGTAFASAINIIGGIAAVIGGAVLAIKEFVDMWVGGWDVIKTILEALGLAIAAVGAVILGAPAVVAGVVAGIVFAVSQLAILLHQHWDAISSWFSETWANFSQWCSTTWQGIVKGIVTAWDGFSSSMQAVWNTTSEWFSSVWSAFKTWAVEIWGEIVQGVLSAWNGFLENIQALWETVSAWFSEVWTAFKEWVATTWLNIVQGIFDAWNGFVEKITEIWEAARVWFESAWGAFHTWADTTWKNITQSIADSWNNLKERASKKWEEIREVIATKWEEIKSNTLNKWEEIKSTLDQKWSTFKRDAETLWNNLKNTLAAVWDSIQDRWSNTWNEIKNAVAQKWNEIVSTAYSIFEGIGDFFKKLWDGIEGTWDSVWSAIQGTVSKWWNNIREDAQTGWDKAVSFVKGLWNDVKGSWDSVWSSIQSNLSNAWGNIKNTALSIWNGISTTLAGIWSKIKEGANSLWDGVSKNWKTAWDGIVGFVKSSINNVLGGIEKLINGAISGVNWLIEKINAVSPDFIGDLQSIPEVHLPRFATGGFPEDGLFLANHNELVGQFSNGQTAVVNNQQITDGIREAVANAMVPILQEIAANTRETADKDMSLNIDSREIARANAKGQSKLGRTILSTT